MVSHWLRQFESTMPFQSLTFEAMKTRSKFLLVSMAAISSVVTLAFAGQANPADQTPPPATVNTLTTPAEGANGATPASAPQLSYGLDEIVKMVQSGTGTDVVLNFVENSPIAYSPTAEDVIRLKELGVPSEVTVAILKHGGKLRTQQLEASRQNAPAPVQPPTSPPPSSVNPYSYDNSSIATTPADYTPSNTTYVYSGYPAYSYVYPNWWYVGYPGYWWGYLWPYYNCGYYYYHGSWCYAPHYYGYGHGSWGYVPHYNNPHYNNYPRGSWGYYGRYNTGSGYYPRPGPTTYGAMSAGGRAYRGGPATPMGHAARGR